MQARHRACSSTQRMTRWASRLIASRAARRQHRFIEFLRAPCCVLVRIRFRCRAFARAPRAGEPTHQYGIVHSRVAPAVLFSS
eukprot:3065870-Lingulodinium_polyedra.AAC.1